MDKGGADLIASGDIKIKQGASPTSFTKDGLLFSDGTEVRADAVIFACVLLATVRQMCSQY